MDIAELFLVTPTRAGCRIRSEVRIAAIDSGSAERFARYWRLIRPASAAMRREVVRAAARTR